MSGFPDVNPKYDEILLSKNVSRAQWGVFKKWVRFYLHFCVKYNHNPTDTKSLPLFIEKLASKKQMESQRTQAISAVEYYRALLSPNQEASQVQSGPIKRFGQTFSSKFLINQANTDFTYRKDHYQIPSENEASRFSKLAEPSVRFKQELTPANKTRSDANTGWLALETALRNEIMLRHYSPKTLKSYRLWLRKLRGFLFNKDPSQLDSVDAKRFLTDLAVEKGVSASAQNQAFNALLFLFRYILKKELGDLSDTPRAKLSKYVPTVLSKEEIEAFFAELKAPYKLIAMIMYGCGLRLSEVVNLRIQNFNFDTGILSVQFGKGGKSRSIPLPEKIRPEITAQVEIIKNLHREDLKKGYYGVFMPGLFEKKAKFAPKELVWQWFFPAQGLTFVEAEKGMRRYHVHESDIQRAVKSAASRAGIPKRVSPHTLRHTFATHLLQANYDIRTIQTLLGHSDVRTTMIYTHCVPSRTLKEMKSPLDF